MKNSRGFTLVELAIVLTIIALFIAGAAEFLQTYLVKKRQTELIEKTNAITSALALYIQDESFFGDDPETEGVVEVDEFVPDPNGAKYPCPADPTLGPGDDGYGKEARNGNSCDDTKLAKSGSGSNTVYHGAVPFAELKIGAAQTIDPYHYKFSYSVSKSVSDENALKGGKKPSGAITVEQIDSGGTTTTINNVDFVLVHHGPLGIGAYTVGGTRIACDATTREGKNCDNDSTFVDANDYRITKDGSSDFYDDTILVTLRGIADKEEYWAHGNNTQDVMNLNPGNVGIGGRALKPAARLHVQANSGATIASSPINNYDESEGGDGFAIIAEGAGERDDESGGVLMTVNGLDRNRKVFTIWNSFIKEPVFWVTAGGDLHAQSAYYTEPISYPPATVPSDERLKENIRELNNDTLKNLMLLHIIKYNLKEGDVDTKIGVIAQQLQDYFPELVHERKDGMLTVDYVGLIGPIIKGIQELNTGYENDIEEIRVNYKNDINELKQHIEKLESQIQDMKEQKGTKNGG